MALTQRTSMINRDMLKLVERIASYDLATPSMEKELEEIINGKEVVGQERLERLIETCELIDFDKSNKVEIVFKKASDIMSKHLKSISSPEIFDRLVEREKKSSTALSPFFALPHIVVEGKDKFQMVIVRSQKGIHFSDQNIKVHALFFLVGSMDQRHFHLVVISALARLVQSSDFEKTWLNIRSLKELRKFLLKTVKTVKKS